MAVPAVEKSLQPMAIPGANTVPMNATSKTVSKAVVQMTKEQFRAEKLYQMCASIAESMLDAGIISVEEYQQIDTILLEKYKPILGTLLAGKPLQ